MGSGTTEQIWISRSMPLDAEMLEKLGTHSGKHEMLEEALLYL
jgi:hypothetical protein